MLINCINCGAQIEDENSKCPYCGYINENGAEKEYMKELNDIRGKLDAVDDMAVREYGKEYKKIGKTFLITVISLIFLSAICCIIGFLYSSKKKADELRLANEMMERMKSSNEAFSYFDELYETKQYDKLCEAVFVTCKEEEFIFDWDHYAFVQMYDIYLKTQELINNVDEQGWRNSDPETIFYNCCCYYYKDEYLYIYSLSEQDIEELQPATDYMMNILHDRMGYSDEDMTGLRSRIMPRMDIISLSSCYEIAMENIDEYK
ncbi:MAG: zinc ribbon domain-containing protein [Lachnospiraceae bacterium]|nr:zinc ribbon domain-containing protein [Lachnospiraceae bacterium]